MTANPRLHSLLIKYRIVDLYRRENNSLHRKESIAQMRMLLVSIRLWWRFTSQRHAETVRFW